MDGNDKSDHDETVETKGEAGSGSGTGTGYAHHPGETEQKETVQN
jgi:hypothetical protein